MTLIKHIVVAVGLVALSSCGGELVRLHHHNAEQRWSVADSLSAEFAVTDSLQPHRLRLNLTLTEDFPYRNLYLRFRLIDPKGRVQSTTPEFVLQDAYGNWHASRNLAGHYALTAILNDSAVFRPAGAWRLSLMPYTRADTLVGVKEVSFSVEPR